MLYEIYEQIFTFNPFFRELADANRQYKEKLKQYIKEGVPIEKTDIGRIAKLVRKIIKENELMHATKYCAGWIQYMYFI